jgi:hypothetical protein
MAAEGTSSGEHGYGAVVARESLRQLKILVGKRI